MKKPNLIFKMFKLKSKTGSKCATVQQKESAEKLRGSKCATVQQKESAEKLRATLESENVKVYVDEIDDEYLISWE